MRHFSGRWPTSLVRESPLRAATRIAVALAEVVQEICLKIQESATVNVENICRNSGNKMQVTHKKENT